MKKIRLVVKLPSPPAARPRRPPVVSSVSSSSSSPSPSPDSSSSSYVEDDSPWDNGGEEEETVRPPRKRRIDSCGDVAAPLFSRSGRHEVRKKTAVGRSSGDGCGTLPSSWSGTPMPERKELELLLHKLQKNDIYGAFAEPVDPEELPDYHDVIEHPMDFSTVRKKLARGAYRFFEQFEVSI
ncbi:Transcription initiation factor TFIID subunit 1-A [Platanthera zijinensis]|uniref:Transcription initiation factor TFIID subunit 1-A n=1 Tax=Platanthera zijinensis TaxID=2320716 RepID=A0AAP0AX63_9ASPA